MGPLLQFAGDKRLLLAVAAPNEAKAVWAAIGTDRPLPPTQWQLILCRPPFELVLTGVGKASAAGAIARLAHPARHAGVISIGVAGAMPGQGLNIGDAILADQCSFADEGIQASHTWTDLASRGFPPGPWPGLSVPTDKALRAALAPLANHTGPITTVSTCSGSDSLATERARRTRALAEAMEGAAIAASCSRIGLPFAELRVISNHCGSAPAWDLSKALARLTDVLGRFA